MTLEFMNFLGFFRFFSIFLRDFFGDRSWGGGVEKVVERDGERFGRAVPNCTAPLSGRRCRGYIRIAEMEALTEFDGAISAVGFGGIGRVCAVRFGGWRLRHLVGKEGDT